MDEFNRCNKLLGVHWLKIPVEEIRISVKLKSLDAIHKLPKYEDYLKNSSTNIQQICNENEEHIFKWQEKVFNAFEFENYSNIHNCVTDTELEYHDLIKNHNHRVSKISTYVHDDYYLPLPPGKKISDNSVDSKILSLNTCLRRLNLDNTVISSSSNHLFRSDENIAIETEQWTAMHIVLDNSKYNEDSELLLKKEAILVSLYHNVAENYIIVSPDLNDLELNPYIAETKSGSRLGYQYGIEINFDDEDNDDELVTLFSTLSKKWDKKNRHLLNFEMPTLGRKQYHVTIEIVSATGFEADNIYVEYNLKIPDNIKCDDSLHGRSHTTKALKTEEGERWNFGHAIQLVLDTELSEESHQIKLVFEVISVDSWCRHRTEGYTCLPLTLQPGYYTRQLSCSRPDELNTIEAESRRFFVGGCNLIKDLDVLITSQLEDLPFRFVTTGNLDLRISVMAQASSGSMAKSPHSSRMDSASAILMGADAVLRQYKKARARLAAATKDLVKSED